MEKTQIEISYTVLTESQLANSNSAMSKVTEDFDKNIEKTDHISAVLAVPELPALPTSYTPTSAPQPVSAPATKTAPPSPANPDVAPSPVNPEAAPKPVLPPVPKLEKK